MMRMVRRSNDACQHPATMGDDTTPHRDVSLRRHHSMGPLASMEESSDVLCAPKRTAFRRLSIRRGGDQPRRCRIDKSHLQANRRGDFTKVDSFDSLVLEPESSTQMDQCWNMDSDETLGEYFDVMKKRSDERRSLLHLDNHDIFLDASQCAQTVFGQQSFASEVLTVRSEPLIRKVRSRRKKNSKKEHRRIEGSTSKSSQILDPHLKIGENQERSCGGQQENRFDTKVSQMDNSTTISSSSSRCGQSEQIHFERDSSRQGKSKKSKSRLSRRVYAQLNFVDGLACVEYAKLPPKGRCSVSRIDEGADPSFRTEPQQKSKPSNERETKGGDKSSEVAKVGIQEPINKIKKLSSSAA